MALSIAHAAAGYLVYEAARPSGPHRPGLLAGAVVLANAADLDFVPGLLVGQPDLLHRGFTHTLAGVALAVVVAVIGGRLLRGTWTGGARLAGFVGAAYGSHLLLDYLTVDVVPPHGAQFLWPFSAEYYEAPVPLLGELIVDRSSTLGFVRSLLTTTAMVRWGTDLLLLASAVGAVHAWRSATAPAITPVGEES